MTSSEAFGPDKNLPLDFGGKTIQVRYKPGDQVVASFGYAAWWENASDLYDNNYMLMAERGNADPNWKKYAHNPPRSSDDFPIPGLCAPYFFVTGWNKPGPPDPSHAWEQSEYIGIDQPQENVVIIKFRDRGNKDDKTFANHIVTLRSKSKLIVEQHIISPHN